MKVVLLAGGRGTRLAEETSLRPKPMVEIGGKPLLWHIMTIYAGYGFKDFLVACGYKGEMIKEYFRDLPLHITDFTVDLKSGAVDVMSKASLDWKVGLVDTGLDTMTGGRLRRLAPHLTGTFMCTYGDGVGSVDIGALVKFHQAHGRKATVTAVRPPARFGGLNVDGDGAVAKFSEKPQTEQGWINGGFFVFEPSVLSYLDSDQCILERDPLERLADEGELMAFRHEGFWQPMDTLREKELLESLWTSGQAPWAGRA